VTDDLLSTDIEAAGGQTPWNTLGGLTVDLSIGGPPWTMFNAGTDNVARQTRDGLAVATLASARAALKGHLRATPLDTLHLGYFFGAAPPSVALDIRNVELCSNNEQAWR